MPLTTLSRRSPLVDDALDVVDLAVVERAGDLLFEHLGHAEDAGERGAQLVADHGQELVLELAGALEFGEGSLQVGGALRHALLEHDVGVVQQLLVQLLVGDVAVDADHAHGLPLLS